MWEERQLAGYKRECFFSFNHSDFSVLKLLCLPSSGNYGLKILIAAFHS